VSGFYVLELSFCVDCFVLLLAVLWSVKCY